MSLIGRLFGEGKRATRPARVRRPGTPGADHASLAGAAPVDAPILRNAEREKIARSQRRHAIYATVRESMIAAGVLSASYKFKVLAADKAGTDFLIMVDLAHPLPGGASQMTWIEGLIERMASARHTLDVSGVCTGVWWTRPSSPRRQPAPARRSHSARGAPSRPWHRHR